MKKEIIKISEKEKMDVLKRSKSRERIHRPAVFKDHTKYDRNRRKQADRARISEE